MPNEPQVSDGREPNKPGPQTQWAALAFVVVPAVLLGLTAHWIDPIFADTRGMAWESYQARERLKPWVFVAAFLWLPLSVALVLLWRYRAPIRPAA